jgi:hypothetical protein
MRNLVSLRRISNRWPDPRKSGELYGVARWVHDDPKLTRHLLTVVRQFTFRPMEEPFRQRITYRREPHFAFRYRALVLGYYMSWTIPQHVGQS